MVTYDIHADNNLQDINTDAGFIYALILCMRIGSGKFCWLAPLCSSWCGSVGVPLAAVRYFQKVEVMWRRCPVWLLLLLLLAADAASAGALALLVHSATTTTIANTTTTTTTTVAASAGATTVSDAATNHDCYHLYY